MSDPEPGAGAGLAGGGVAGSGVVIAGFDEQAARAASNERRSIRKN
jgi:hypothetical protein